jgi:alkyl sulfatase BDS1-like metallo-beta-lactamase superfamily hydrolase
MTDDHENPLAGGAAPLAFREIAERIWVRDVLPGMGNGMTIERDDGLVQLDTGFDENFATEIITEVRQVSDRPVSTIVYSHGHVFYNFGVNAWLRHAEERGEPRPQIVAHERLPKRYARYRDTLEFQTLLTGWQSGFGKEAWQGNIGPFVDPDVVVGDRHDLGDEHRPIVLLAAPAETDDALAVWLPRQRVLYGGPATIMSIPNVGTPLRTQRDPIAWAETLDAYLALDPEVLVREFGPELHGRDEISEVLTSTAEALRWLHRETITRLNKGLDIDEIITDIEYPTEWASQPWMAPTYGHPDFIVRDIYRSETGWWDRNITTLHPAPRPDVTEAIRSAIADPAQVIATAEKLRGEGSVQLALHVIDLLALSEGDDSISVAARALKAELADDLAATTTSYISANLYRTMPNYPYDRAD